MASRPITPLVFLEDASAGTTPMHPAHGNSTPSFADYVKERQPKEAHEFTPEQKEFRRTVKGEQEPTRPELTEEQVAAEVPATEFPQDDIPAV